MGLDALIELQRNQPSINGSRFDRRRDEGYCERLKKIAEKIDEGKGNEMGECGREKGG